MIDAKPAKPPALRGFLQALQPTRIRGWAFAPGEPDAHLRIEVFIDGEPMTQAVASTHFPDLEKNGIGAGDHGFVIHFRAALPIEEPDRIEVVAIGPGGARRTLGLPEARMAGPAPAVAPAAKPVAAGGAAGGQHPVFILGSARSGTSAMVKALRRTGRYQGFSEGHFLHLLGRLVETVDGYYTPIEQVAALAETSRRGTPLIIPEPAGRTATLYTDTPSDPTKPHTLLTHIRKAVVLDMLAAGFGTIMRDVHPGTYWIDKTPGPAMIWMARVLMRTWPNGRIIFMKRRPVDNIESRRRKFPDMSFEAHCRLWTECMIAWSEVRGTLGKVSIEVDQAELVADPAEVGRRLAGLLKLSAAEAEHVRASLASEDRPQRTGRDLAPGLSLADVDWTAAMKQQFREICGPAIAIYGYEADLADTPPAPPRKESTRRRKPADC